MTPLEQIEFEAGGGLRKVFTLLTALQKRRWDEVFYLTIHGQRSNANF
jgi:hypothetical protein